MKNQVSIILLIIIIFSFSSCMKKYSAGELIAQELKQVIIDNNVERVLDWRLDSDFDNASIYGNYGTDYYFSGQFININDEYFNLNSLIKYEVKDKSGINFLLLYFY